MDKIYTAKDDAKRKKMPGVTAYVRSLSVQMAQRGLIPFPWDGRTVTGEPVYALVDHGRWMAICDKCNNPEYVDPDEPIFFCCRCGNGDQRSARPVAFPQNRAEIEAALLSIEIVPGFGRTELEKMMNGKGVNGEVRNWVRLSAAPLSPSTQTSPQMDPSTASGQAPLSAQDNLGGESGGGER